MTYSHNSVSKNLKMTTAAAATSAETLQQGSKRVSHGGGGGSYSSSSKSPSSTPPPSAHSNSIASSTNYHPHQYNQLSSSPPGCPMSSAMSTSSTCSSSSGVSSMSSSNGNSSSGSGGSFTSTRKQNRSGNNHHQQQQQRRSPQQGSESGGSYFSNNNQANGKRLSGGGQKYREGQRSPQGGHTVRQSPSAFLCGAATTPSSPPIQPNGTASTRRMRSKHSSPLLSLGGGGKISPTHPLIPTALTHFAGSKCFDAPAPNALPKPPEHWTLSKSESKISSSAGPSLQSVLGSRCQSGGGHPHNFHHHHHSNSHAVDAHTYGGHVVKTSKRNLLDDFDTHNLKLLLNVQS